MVRLVVALVVALATVTFAVENDRAVRLVFVGYVFPAVPLPVLIFAALLVGAIAVALIGGVELFRLRRHAISLERQLAARGPEADPAPGSPPSLPHASSLSESAAQGGAVCGDDRHD